MTDYKALGKALKTLDAAPKAVALADQKYQEELREIKTKEATRHYSPSYIDREKANAKQKHDQTVNALVDGMKSALETVRANNRYDSEDLKLDDPKLSNALRLIDIMGKSMDHATQVNILNQFRGNLAALRVLEGAYKKNGLYFEKMAHEMQTPISNQTLDDMEITLAYFDHDVQTKGIYNLDMSKRSNFSRGDFAKQAQRLGIDLNGEPDPYEYALHEMKRAIEESNYGTDIASIAAADAQIMALDMAARDMADAKKAGRDQAEVFNSAIERIARMSKPVAAAEAE